MQQVHTDTYDSCNASGGEPADNDDAESPTNSVKSSENYEAETSRDSL